MSKPKVFAHFIGIGGAGMSALARVLAQRGITVTGSDMKESRYTVSLKKLGVPIFIGHDGANVGDPEVVVVSTAIPESNPELAYAREKKLKVWPRAKMLAHLAGNQKTVAVAGTHGKTSTSSMIATMLYAMELSPSFCIGGEVDGINSNAEHGTGEHYVVEADESDGSFLHLSPYIGLITNLEADHMDHYRDFAEIVQTFEKFVHRIQPGGTLVYCGDDPELSSLVQRVTLPCVSYGFGPHCDIRFETTQRVGIGTGFSVFSFDKYIAETAVQVPGVHMVSNACAAIAVAHVLGLSVEQACKAIKTFSGVRRRFDLIDEVNGVTIVDDYAHHPTEVAATLVASADLDFQRTIVIFQPHRYSRTQVFAQDFGKAFRSADLSIILDVYSAGESPIPGVNGKTLIDAILDDEPHSHVSYLPHRRDVVKYLIEITRPGDLVLTMGAGDVTGIGPDFARALAQVH